MKSIQTEDSRVVLSPGLIHVDLGARSATVSTCGRYRYALERRTGVDGPKVAWIMLNPSTADANVDDPTIRKVVGFSQRNGFGVAMVVNLYAWRATDPRELRALLNPPGLAAAEAWQRRARRERAEGPENRRAIEQALKLADVVICAWGAQRWARTQADRVMKWLAGRPLVCLGTSKDGSPRHPLMVAYAQPLEPFVGGAS